jgi:hypothetical protein
VPSGHFTAAAAIWNTPGQHSSAELQRHLVAFSRRRTKGRADSVTPNFTRGVDRAVVSEVRSAVLT